MPNPIPSNTTTDEQPDYERGLFLSEKMGLEFNSVGRSGIITQLIVSQGFAMLFLIPIILFFGIRNLLGGSILVASLAAGGTGAALITLGIIALLRVKGSHSPGIYLKSSTDTRYRIRAIIPPRRPSYGFRQWAEVTLHVKPKEQTTADTVTPDALDAEHGGFEPLIIRPWFGIARPKAYWLAAIICGIISAAFLLFLMQYIFGGWGGMLKDAGFLGYAGIGFTMVAGALGAELLYPIYIRVVPGQLDVFRYQFLGSGKPEVKTYDLRTIGICVDFGSFSIALEPPRVIGEPIPEFVAAKRWPHTKVHPEGHTPDYFSLALSPGRMLNCQRLVQAARTTEPTPQLPIDKLLG